MDEFNNFNNDYWSMGMMTMGDNWSDTWDNGSDFYIDPGCDTLDELLD